MIEFILPKLTVLLGWLGVTALNLSITKHSSLSYSIGADRRGFVVYYRRLLFMITISHFDVKIEFKAILFVSLS